jgi:hypothetical protein
MQSVLKLYPYFKILFWRGWGQTGSLYSYKLLMSTLITVIII